MAPIVLDNFCPNHVSVGGLQRYLGEISIKMAHRIYMINIYNDIIKLILIDISVKSYLMYYRAKLQVMIRFSLFVKKKL